MTKARCENDCRTLLGAALSLQGQAQTVVTNGLVAYYPFTSSANDATGNGYNGEVHGAKLVSDRFGCLNSAYSFSGSNCFILLTNSFSLAGDWTVSAWTRTTSLNQEGILCISGQIQVLSLKLLRRTAMALGWAATMDGSCTG